MSRVGMLGAAVVIVAALALLFFSAHGKTGDTGGAPGPAAASAVFAQAGSPIKYAFDAQPSFCATPSGNLFFCSTGGVKYITGGGAEKWNYAFSAQLPTLAGSGDAAAVAEANGNYIYVFNTSGLLYSKKFDLPILSFAVNPSGFAAVILKDGAGFQVEVDGPGFSPYQRQLRDQNVIPVTAAVSNDGRILGINFLNTNLTSAKYSSYLAFTYVNKEDSAASGKDFFASKLLDDHITADLRFADGGRVLAFSDNQIEAMQVGLSNLFKEQKTLALTNKLDQLAFMPGGGFAAALGARFAEGQGKSPGTIEFYDSALNLTGSYDLGKPATYLSAANGKAIAASGRDYRAIDPRGRLLWKYSSTQDFKQVLFLNNSDTVLFVSSTEADIMKRKQ